MEGYGSIKRTTWRGARVWKTRKFIKSYRKVIEREFSTNLISDLLQTDDNEEIRKYAHITALKTVQEYIESVFGMQKGDDKKEFKKKIFSGAKIVSVLEFIDFQIRDLESRRNQLVTEPSYLFSKSIYSKGFSQFWEEHSKMYQQIKRWIQYGYEIDETDSNVDLIHLLADLNDMD